MWQGMLAVAIATFIVYTCVLILIDMLSIKIRKRPYNWEHDGF
jgi:hypothetical protein